MKAGSLLLTLALITAGCNTQRVPGPMGRPEGLMPVGQGADYVPGPQEVVVLRHGDPVTVRRPGAVSGFPLSYHQNRLRLGSGGFVSSGLGGRAEILWPGTPSAIQMLDSSVAMVGEPSRAEPILRLLSCSAARILLQPGDRVALVGGAELLGADALEYGDDVTAGPFEFATTEVDRIAIGNNGSTIAQVTFLEEVIDLGPGEVLELPILPGGAGPESVPFGRVEVAVDDNFVGPKPMALGELERIPRVGSLALRAGESAQVQALGVSVDLKPGEEVIFTPSGTRP